MNKPYHLCMLITGRLAALACAVTQNLQMPDVKLDLISGDLSEASANITNAEKRGVEVFISGAAFAAEIRRCTSTPISEIAIQDIDYLTAAKKALQLGKKPVLVTYRYSPPVNISALSEVLNYPLAQIRFEDEESLFKIIAESEYDVIIGASSACACASMLGRGSVFFYAGEASILQAINNAKSIAAEMRRIKEEAVVFRTILDHSPSGIIVSDLEDHIILINKTAKGFLGFQDKDKTGELLANINPNLSTAKFLSSPMQTEQSFRIINHVRINTVKTRLSSDSRTFGVLTTLFVDNTRKKPVDAVPSHVFSSWADFSSVSQCAQQTLFMAKKYSETASPLIIYGAYGTQKTALAEAIHTGSKRGSAPFVYLNLAGVTERQLLGYKDDESLHKGVLESANNGTVVLQSLENASASIQNCLLAAVAQKSLTPIGDVHSVTLNIRFITILDGQNICSSTVNPELYTRLNVCSLEAPTLSSCKADILLLFETALSSPKKWDQIKKYQIIGDILSIYDWPGNHAELEVVAERLLHSLGGQRNLTADIAQARMIDAIGEDALFQSLLRTYPELAEWKTCSATDLGNTIKEIKHLMRYNDTQICRKLGVSRTTLWRRINKV